jgi:hypothetical protein
MSGERMPFFVDRQSYRRRRLADAARLMPVLGGMLFFLPLFWKGSEGGEGVGTAAVMAYIFGAWALLALASGLLSRHLHEGSDRPDPMREDANADQGEAE